MSASSARLQRYARRTVILLLVSVNAVLVMLNLQKHEVVSSEWLDLEAVLGLELDDEAMPDSIAFREAGAAGIGGSSRLGAGGGAAAAGVAARQPAEIWPGGTPAVPSEPPGRREALLADDGSIRLVGAVPSWSVATELAGYAEARLPAGEDGVTIDYTWHPEADIDARAGVVRLAEPLLYGPGRAEVPTSAEAGLDAVAEILVANPSVLAVVVGYTDDLGESSDNAAVAFARATAVSTYLEAAGVAPDQVVIAAPRPAEPAASNGTVEGRQLNRRLEIELENFLSDPGVVG